MSIIKVNCSCKGETLYSIIAGERQIFHAPCGGKSRCGKCKVVVTGEVSPITENERKFLTESEIAENIRLACMCTADGEVQIHIQEKSDENAAIQTTGNIKKQKLNPPVKLAEVKLPKPSLEFQIDDESSLLYELSVLNLKLKKISLTARRKLSAILRENDFTVDIAYSGDEIIDVFSPRSGDIYGLAVDIGTTTVVGYFYSLTTGSLIKTFSALNPQGQYGADVISRINYVMENADGLGLMQCAIIKQLNEWCGEFVKDRILAASICGNTVMEHFAQGIDARNIAQAPFIPVSKFGGEVRAGEVGLDINEYAPVYFAPAISGYVGGDISAGLLSCGMTSKKLSLFIDIGTNGEIVIGGADGMMACSTAAGPAFEGAHIKFGMGGVPGAINKISKTQNGRIKYETIGGVPPKGICGSGLIDAAAIILESGELDEMGYIEEDFPIAGEICLTQSDIREVQLAKAAISAGILTLMEAYKIKEDDIGEVFLAGGFGSYIDKNSAAAIGLIPKSLLNKIKTVGNSAGMGAVMTLLNTNARKKLSQICSMTKYIELSDSKYFQDAYIDCMMF